MPTGHNIKCPHEPSELHLPACWSCCVLTVAFDAHLQARQPDEASAAAAKPAPAGVAPPSIALPSGLSCPICCELYDDPVVLGTSGITYCRACIEDWLGRGNSTCPATDQRASAADIRPNFALRD